MKRDMNFIREILKKIENGEKQFITLSESESEILGVDNDHNLSSSEADRWNHHLQLIQKGGLARLSRNNLGWSAEGLTWQGHEYLDKKI